ASPQPKFWPKMNAVISVVSPGCGAGLPACRRAKRAFPRAGQEACPTNRAESTASTAGFLEIVRSHTGKTQLTQPKRGLIPFSTRGYQLDHPAQAQPREHEREGERHSRHRQRSDYLDSIIFHDSSPITEREITALRRQVRRSRWRWLPARCCQKSYPSQVFAH